MPTLRKKSSSGGILRMGSTKVFKTVMRLFRIKRKRRRKRSKKADSLHEDVKEENAFERKYKQEAEAELPSAMRFFPEMTKEKMAQASTPRDHRVRQGRLYEPRRFRRRSTLKPSVAMAARRSSLNRGERVVAQAGDTLAMLAERHGATPEQVVAMNKSLQGAVSEGITAEGLQLYPGQILVIRKSPASPAVPASAVRANPMTTPASAPGPAGPRAGPVRPLSRVIKLPAASWPQDARSQMANTPRVRNGLSTMSLAREELDKGMHRARQRIRSGDMSRAAYDTMQSQYYKAVKALDDERLNLFDDAMAMPPAPPAAHAQKTKISQPYVRRRAQSAGAGVVEGLAERVLDPTLEWRANVAPPPVSEIGSVAAEVWKDRRYPSIRVSTGTIASSNAGDGKNRTRSRSYDSNVSRTG